MPTIHHKRLFYSIAVFCLCFVLVRLPYYLLIGLPGYLDDSDVYAQMSTALLNGSFGKAGIFAPGVNLGYPLFLVLISLVSSNAMAIMWAQTLVSFFTGCLMLVAILRTYPRYLWAVCVALIVTYTSQLHIYHETLILTESLYINCLVLFTATVILALKRNKVSDWLMCSLMVLVTLVIRPAGIFLIAIYLLLLGFMIWNHYNKTRLLAFLSPFLAVFLALCSYNYVRYGNFSFAPSPGSVTILPVSFMMEPSPAYPKTFNEAIILTQQQLPETERQTIAHSWDIDSLKFIFINRADLLVEAFREHSRKNGRLANEKEIVLKIGEDALRNKPEIYAKFVISMLYQYFESIDTKRTVAYKYLRNYIDDWGIKMLTFMRSEANQKRRVAYFEVEHLTPTDLDQKIADLQQHPLHRFINWLYTYLLNPLFHNLFWLFIWALVGLWSVVSLVKSRFRSPEAFLVLVIVCINTFSAVLTCLIQMGMIRYSSTTHFTYYLAPALVGLIVPSVNVKTWFKPKSSPAEPKPNTQAPVQSKNTTTAKTKKKK